MAHQIHSNAGSLVLGVLIARASGQSLERFFAERFFEPLGMKDTGFSVPAEKLDRMASYYMKNPETGLLELQAGSTPEEWSRPPAFPSGASGLASTADDFLAFARMLLNKGAHKGGRILSERSVELMATDHLTPEQKAVSGFFPGYFDNRGWGFGVSMITKPDDISAVPGRYGWDGGYGTAWINDPHQDLVAIIMAQTVDFIFSDGLTDFLKATYKAIEA